MHLDEDSYRRLQSGEEFAGAEDLAAHLETACPQCEAFLQERRPTSVLRPRLLASVEAAPRAHARTAAAPPARLGRSMRTDNLALMLTDIEGYTARTSRQSRAENERLLQLHETLLLPVFRAFDGTVRKSIGDAFLVTFTSPTNAVLCGAAIQDRLFSFNQTAPEPDRFEIRVVVNVGEVRALPDDVFGEPLNLAKAIEERAQAREVTFTEAVYLVMNKAEVPSVELGQFELHGSAEPVKLFKIPRGAGRLTSGPLPLPQTGAELPFSGLGLARAGNLPPPDLAAIERQLVARQSRRALKARIVQFLRSPAGLRAVAAGSGALLVVAALLAVHFHKPPIERAIESGDLAQARALIDKLDSDTQRTFWQARLDEQQRRWDDAIDGFTRAARGSPELVEPAIDRMGTIARDADCDAQERVARALGRLGNPYAKSVLVQLTKVQPEKSGGLAGIFGSSCDPAAAARASLAELGAR